MLVVVGCPSCGKPYSGHAPICSRCGKAAILPTEERPMMTPRSGLGWLKLIGGFVLAVIVVYLILQALA